MGNIIRINRVVWVALISIVVSTLTACMPEQGGVTVTSPTENQVIINRAFSIAMTYPSGTAQPAVTLNGRNISQLVSFQATAASIASTVFAYALVQGTNTLSVQAPGKAAIVRSFKFDNAGPKVSFTSINRSGNNINVQGKVTDASAITSVTINSATVAIGQNGSFSASVAKVAAYGVKARDANGIWSYDHYLASGAVVDPMIRASVDQTLIDDVGPLVAAAMGIPKDPSIFDVINPLVDAEVFGLPVKVNLLTFQIQTNTVGGLLGTATVNSLVVSPANNSGTVTANISIEKPIIGVDMLILGLPLKVNIRADRMDINGANLKLSTNVDQELVVEFTGQLPIDLLNTKLEIIDNPLLGVLVSNPISDIVVAVVTDLIEPALSAALPAVINPELANRLQDLFLGLNINDNNVLFKTGISSFSKQGTNVLANLTAQYKVKSPVLNSYALGVKTAATINQATGAVTVGGGVLPLPNNFGQLDATVSFDFINQAMLFAFEAGLLDLNLVGDQIVIGEEQVNAAASDGDLWIQVKPSVPELQLLGGTSRANVSVNLNAFELNVSSRAAGDWVSLMKLIVNVNLLAGFGFDNSSKSLFLETADAAPVINVQQIQTFGIPLPPELANGVVGLAVPAIADLLMAFFKIQLPIPADLPVQIKNISTVGTNGQHLSISFDVDLQRMISNLLSGQPAS